MTPRDDVGAPNPYASGDVAVAGGGLAGYFYQYVRELMGRGLASRVGLESMPSNPWPGHRRSLRSGRLHHGAIPTRTMLGEREIDGLADPDEVVRDILDNLANARLGHPTLHRWARCLAGWQSSS